KDTTNSQPAQAADSPAMNADNADLLRVLQGRWQNSLNTQDEIEIEGNHIKHFNTGQLNREGSIEADAGCVISPCNAESAAQEDGWCFIEKAPNMEQCHLVLQCNKDSLQFKSLNDAGTLMSYRKVK
ncbi:MAG: hypothetical protein IT269_14540, partial [Saprospiraceae bacterium]|nr:hypothetical protein [Saprospiraceae bacterium]